MEWLALIIPIIISLLGLYFFKNRLVWFEVILPVLASIIIILICKYFMLRSYTNDTEYYSNYIENVTHYDEWDEWIEQTCSTTDCDSDGKNCTTTYYDCSYRQNHPEYWEAELNNGNKFYISQEYYNSIVSEWQNTAFVEMNRDYYRIDGDAQRSFWNEKFSSLKSYDSEGTYKNKPQTSETMFYFESLKPEEIKEVFEYPNVSNNNQNTCIDCTEYENQTLRKINALNGQKLQIKVFVLVFKNKTVSVSELQRRFWKGGNKNELVICVDSENKWAKTFSWQDNKTLEVKSNEIFKQKGVSIKDKIIQLHKILPDYWKRKSFSDFDYIEVQLSSNQIIWIYILTFIFSIVILIWGIFNNIES